MLRRIFIPALITACLFLLAVSPQGELQGWVPSSTTMVAGPLIPVQEAEAEEQLSTAQSFAHVRQERRQVSVSPVKVTPTQSSPPVPRLRPAPDILPDAPEFLFLSPRAPPAC
ncbi:hypothetical protein KQI65_13815 [bacterium]|nr:hypothetical protein [bacterium]